MLEAVLLSLERVHQDVLEVAVDRDVAKGHHHDVAAVRGGFVAIARSGSGFGSSYAATLHGYTFVPGVSLSGTLRPGRVLRIAGDAAARGRLRIGADGSVTGTIGGKRVVTTFPPLLVSKFDF